jgi:Tfp pilus assembly protein PilX
MKNSLRAQHGVVLVIALIMMAVIAVASAAAIKAVMTQDTIGFNLRAQAMARHSAEAMLRYCEAAITTPAPTPAQQSIIDQKLQQVIGGDINEGHWVNMANWAAGSAMVVEAPDDFDASGYVPGSKKAQCIVERSGQGENLVRMGGASPPTATLATITARGFSPDFAEGPTGIPTSGATVWLQSAVNTPY